MCNNIYVITVAAKFVTMQNSFFANFACSSYEVRPKWSRSVYEVSPTLVQSSFEVCLKFVRSLPKVRSKFAQSLFKVRPIRVKFDRSLTPALLGSECVVCCVRMSLEVARGESVYHKLWLHSVSTNGRELLVFGKMGTRHHQLQRFWQERIFQPQDKESINF